MTTKLTLSVEKDVVTKAKKYAKARGRSLSEIVTGYLRRLSGGEALSEAVHPDVLAMADGIPVDRIPDLADERYRYLKEKMIHD